MLKSRRSQLEEALIKAEALRPGALPRALPSGHMTKAQYLIAILKSKQLELRYCNVMRCRTLYVFYGGLRYRSTTNPTQEEAEYPVGFVFDPTAIRPDDVHYPFDTGGMASGLLGQLPGVRSFRQSLKFRSSHLNKAANGCDGPRLMVKHLYGSNQAYITGKPSPSAIGKPEPLPTLQQFMLQRATQSDHRRSAIETQRRSALILDSKLLWIGYPDCFEQEILDFLRDIDPHVPEIDPYPSFSTYKPSDVCAQLDGIAHRFLRRYWI